MPRLIAFLRQYGPREYLLTLSLAGLCGLGVAALINASAGDVAGGQALLKTKAQIEANDSQLLTTRVYKPARVSHPKRRQVRHRAAQQSFVRRAAAAQLVAARTPVPSPAPAVVQRVAPQPAPKPAPKPAPAPKHKRSGGGGSLQFDESG